LLDERDRVLFRKLAVFEGSFSLDALAGVAGDDVLDDLHTLADASLVMVIRGAAEPRFRLLETIRDYARERMEASGESDAIQRAHARWFLRAAHRLEDADHDNARAAFQFLLRDDPPAALRLAGALGAFWHRNGHWEEALDRFATALAAAPDAPAADRATALFHLGRLNFFLGAEETARLQLEDAVAGAREATDDVLLARALEALSQAYLKVGDDARADAALSEALPLARDSADAVALAEILITIGTAQAGKGHYPAAREFLDEGLAFARRIESRLLVARGQYFLGAVALLEGDAALALTLTSEAAAGAADVGDLSWTYHLLEMHARSLIAAGEAERAGALIAQSLGSIDSVGSRTCLPHGFEAAARLLIARGDLGSAARLLGAGESVCATLGIAMLPVERALFLQTSAVLVKAGDAELVESGRVEGCSWEADKALAFALQRCT
jgi:tetratricopeptide (TPR) repeat protein